uniref:Uncharacterized protein n=1 Tax=Anguilla anguilla TaxID=7936 RepID=A0A0E9RYT8_ANGAN
MSCTTKGTVNISLAVSPPASWLTMVFPLIGGDCDPQDFVVITE